MKFALCVLIVMVSASAFAKEPASDETALKEALVLSEAVFGSHDRFNNLLADGEWIGTDRLNGLRAPLEAAVDRYDKLRKEDRRISAASGLGSKSKYHRYGACLFSGKNLVDVLIGFSTPVPDRGELPKEHRYLGGLYRSLLMSEVQCGLETGKQPVPDHLRSPSDLYNEVMKQLLVSEEKLAQMLLVENQPDFENDLAGRLEYDWKLNVEVGGIPQSLIAYVGKYNLENPAENYPYSACASSLSTFLEIVHSIERSVSKTKSPSVTKQLEELYSEKKAACNAVLSAAHAK